MGLLTDVTIDELKEALEEIEEDLPTRQLVAAIAYKNGITHAELADWFDVPRPAILDWLAQLERGTSESTFYDDPRPGRPRKLSAEQFIELWELLPNQPEIDDPYPWPSVAADACLMIVGDVNLQNRDDPASAFRHVHETLAEADVLYGNLEGCLYRNEAPPISKIAEWRHSEERMVEALTHARFDAVGGANNVTYGEEATERSMAVLDRDGISYCGVGDTSAAARAPSILSANGVSIGFLQRTSKYYSPDQVATETSPGVAAFDPGDESDLDEIAVDVSAHRADVDVLAFSYHVGATTTETKPFQRDLARRVIDSGADLVFGHGAHRNQCIELYRGRPIFHGIGQFAFDWPAMFDDRDGLLLRIHVEGGELSRVSFVPVYRDAANDVYLARPDSPEGRQQLDEIRRLSPDASISIERPEAVLTLPGR